MMKLNALAITTSAVFLTLGAASAANFVEPPVFSSRNGVLDIVMIARTKPVTAISFKPPGAGTAIHPTGWVYEICYRQGPDSNSCPKGGTTSSEFGGIRLALQPGDRLKVRLINKLPAQDPAKVAHYWNSSEQQPVPDEAGLNLPLTPTNLHTHGLVVQARQGTPQNPTWGDNIYIDIYNPANGFPVPTMHQHGTVVKSGVQDYVIDIPRNEPSGADWFHPHVHGITSDSLSSGLAGIISIGKAADYVGDGKRGFPEQQIRNIILKDMQVLAAGQIGFQQGLSTAMLDVANGDVLDDQQDPQFCAQFPGGSSDARDGSCPGADNSASGGNDYTGGQWYFPVSGVIYPKIAVSKPLGELWRISNIGASATYRLELFEDKGRYPMMMQLISVDGISIHVPAGTSQPDIVKLGGARVTVVPCPGTVPPGATQPVCVKDLVMLPGARTEVWVTYRSRNGEIAPPPRGASATLRSTGITTGDPGVGDPWPAVNLAPVTFKNTYTGKSLVSLALAGDALAANQPQGIFFEPVPYAQPATPPAGCKALDPGHYRRIFFGLVDTNNPNIFGLGYEEVDENGVTVPTSKMPITAFSPMNNFICLPLGPGQTPVHEAWELVNLATENHNFHIHQTKFRTVDPTAAEGTPMSPKLDPAVGAGVMEDMATLPLAEPVPAVAQQVMTNQNGYCTIDQWRSRKCRTVPTLVDIPFAELGAFVYHCHILEHEDAGMMAKIQVVAAPK